VTPAPDGRDLRYFSELLISRAKRTANHINALDG
jgi:hypothetical protein